MKDTAEEKALKTINPMKHDGLWGKVNDLSKSIKNTVSLDDEIMLLKKKQKEEEVIVRNNWANIESFMVEKNILNYKEMTEGYLEFNEKNSTLDYFLNKPKNDLDLFLEKMISQRDQ